MNKLKDRLKRRKELREHRKVLKEQNRDYKIEKIKLLSILIASILTITVLFLGVIKLGNDYGVKDVEKYNQTIEDKEKESITERAGHFGGDTILIKEKSKYESTIEELNKLNKNKEEFYVYYYSPYCGFCEQVHELIEDKFTDLDAKTIVVDVNLAKDFQDKQGIETTPTLAHYKDGKKVSYVEGARESKVYDDYFENDKTLKVE